MISQIEEYFVGLHRLKDDCTDFDTITGFAKDFQDLSEILIYNTIFTS